MVNAHLNERRHVFCLFLDFSKAFDTLKHSEIVDSLQRSGIRGKTLNWLEKYLSDRKLTVKIKDTFYDLKKVENGVPQGSILGPLLYIIYINSIFSVPKYADLFMYADDTVLVVAHEDLQIAERLLQKDYNRIQKFYHDSSISENQAKTKLLHIRSPHLQFLTEPKILSHSFDCLHVSIADTCHCKAVETVDEHVYLGIVVDVVSETNVCPVAGLTLDEAAAFLAGVRARRAADRR